MSKQKDFEMIKMWREREGKLFRTQQKIGRLLHEQNEKIINAAEAEHDLEFLGVYVNELNFIKSLLEIHVEMLEIFNEDEYFEATKKYMLEKMGEAE